MFFVNSSNVGGDVKIKSLINDGFRAASKIATGARPPWATIVIIALDSAISAFEPSTAGRKALFEKFHLLFLKIWFLLP